MMYGYDLRKDVVNVKTAADAAAPQVDTATSF
jgi:hypothetical protein